MQATRHWTYSTLFTACLWLLLGNTAGIGQEPSKLALKYKDYNLVLVSFDALQAVSYTHLTLPTKA